MTKQRDVLARLASAETLEEQTWVVTEQLLSQMSRAVREAMLAVAVPHWFNEGVLRALLPERDDKVGSVYEKLLGFSFVEPHGKQGYRLHELTRKATIGYLSREKPEWYEELSRRAKQYFEKVPRDNERIEAVYHEFAFDEAAACHGLVDLFWDLDYRDETAAMSLLLTYVGEHGARLGPLTKLWLRYLEGRRLVVAREWEKAEAALQPLVVEAKGTAVEPWVLIELAKMQERAGYVVRARAEYSRALALAQAFGDNRCIARACGCLGDSLSRHEQFEEATKYYEMALAIDHKRKDQKRECEQLRGLGDVYLRRKWWKEAEGYYRQSLELAQSLPDITLGAWALNGLGLLEEKMQHWAEAIEWYEQSRKLFEDLNQYGNVGKAVCDIGDVLRQAKRYEEAEAAYKGAAETYLEIGDRVEEAWTFNRLGILEAARQQWDAAIGWYERAREVSEELHQPANVALITRNIGVVLRDAKRYEEAEAAYREAAETYREIRDRVAEAGTFNHLGILEAARQQWDAAIGWYERARQVFVELKQPANAAVVTCNIGDVLAGAKRYEEAEAAYQAAVETYRGIGDRVEEAWTFNRLGVLEEARQQWDAATGWHERAREVFEELKQPANAAVVTRNIGNVLRDARRYEEAETAYGKVVDMFQALRDLQEQSETLLSLGNLYRTQHKVDAAIASYQQAIQAYDRNWDAHLALGLLQLKDEPEHAEQACQRSLNGFPVHKILAHVGIAATAAVRSEPSQVRKELEIAQGLLAEAQERHTAPRSQLEALRIVVSAPAAPKQALQDSKAFDLGAVPVEERDLIEIALGYLSVLANQLLMN